MTPDELAKVIVAGIERHQTRGLVYDATGMFDVVMHGRVNMLSVADDVLGVMTRRLPAPRPSWSSWFARDVTARRLARRLERERAELIAQLQDGLSSADQAILRLRLRDLGVDLAACSAAAPDCPDEQPPAPTPAP